MAKTKVEPANHKARFCAGLPWGIQIDWFDLSGAHSLGPDRLAIIELATHATHGHYPGMRVRITSRTKGEIDSKYFLFDDYLDKSREGRADDREDYPESQRAGCFMVIDHVGWHWYIAQPRTATPFCRAIERWIEHWRTR
jgi:hypothetical protein